MVTTQSLITKDGRVFQTNQMSATIDHMNQLDGGLDNFILYVHGRGKEPGKSISSVIPDLMDEYTAKVMMFHWSPSWNGPIGFPVGPAQAAGVALCSVIRQLGHIRSTDTKLAGVKTTLLVHSMGNHVLREAILKCGCDSEVDVFDTVLISSADVEVKNHYQWIERMNLSKNIYVSINEHDVILNLSSIRNGEKKLGCAREKIIKHNEKIANNAVYFDVSELGVNHRYFLKKGQEDNSYLKKIYDSVLNGKPFCFQDGSGAIWKGVENKIICNGNNVYEIKAE